jgi:hypothetical protein
VVSVKAQLLIGVVAASLSGCLPYPVHSPRVDPGLSVGGVVGMRAVRRGDAGASRSAMSPSVEPEVALAVSAGVGRSDGTSPALRIGGTFGFPGPMEGDAYAQLPRVGPIIGGAGVLFGVTGSSTDRRYASALPYGSLGWQLDTASMLYGSVTFIQSHRKTAPDSTISAQAIVLGYERRRSLPYGRGSGSTRVFVAAFRANHDLESTPVLFGSGPTPMQSLFVVGVSFDAVLPWNNRPIGPPGRRPRWTP